MNRKHQLTWTTHLSTILEDAIAHLHESGRVPQSVLVCSRGDGGYRRIFLKNSAVEAERLRWFNLGIGGGG